MIELHITDTGIEGTVFDALGSIVSTTRYQSEANLPAELRDKLSALRLVGSNDPVADVGQRVSDTIFWIHDTEERAGFMMAVLMQAAVKRKESLRNYAVSPTEFKERIDDTFRDLSNRAKRSPYWRNPNYIKRSERY